MRRIPDLLPALVAVIPLGIFGGACSGDDAAVPLRVRLVVTTPDPLPEARRVRLIVTGEDLDPVARETERPALSLSVPSVPLGRARVLTVEGLDDSGDAVAIGRSSPFELTRDSPEQVTVLLAPPERFASLAAKLKQPRYAHSATVLPDGRVVIAGGWDADGDPLASVEVYDPDTATFVAAPKLAEPRAEHRAVLVGKRIALIGGHTGPTEDRKRKLTASIEIYEIESGIVEMLFMDRPRVGHSASPLADGTVLVTGGDQDDGLSQTTEIVDPVNLTIGQGPEFKVGRMGHTAVSLPNGRVLIAGGELNSSFPDPEPAPFVPTADARLYAPADGRRWVSVEELPKARSRAEAALLPDGRVLVMGGLREGGQGIPATTALLFDDAGFSTVTTATLPDLHRHAATALPRGALVAGGDQTDEAWLFVDNAFRSAGKLVRPRRAFTLSLLPSGAALAVGGHDGEKPLDDVEIFITP